MSESAYIEKWQMTCVKSNEFYETHAAERTYFYTVDLQGRLFLEETTPKNIATSLKSEKFLDFFFSQLCRNDTGEFTDYPFFSPCGKEKNYIRPACQGVVFHDLQYSRDDGSGELIWGGKLKQRFDPSQLVMSDRTGRLYHRLFYTSG
eukprot:CAMPEP_0118633246 /NCGR_PEP_ID=MMETSP0785-20121206/891_1 /TAXON_ID=91992 /ORGANISM="Bolidomonas pacifica, Strain CCMP 1866" /LENGTH=147 /DNA_ID=CAMNT_0006524101 /DNA_START=185 /DNA_END=625 /DNA_ORIENTATION=+